MSTRMSRLEITMIGSGKFLVEWMVYRGVIATRWVVWLEHRLRTGILISQGLVYGGIDHC